MSLTESEYVQIRDDIAHSRSEGFEAFVQYIWGDDARMAKLESILDAKSINNNIVLTRGVCKEVQEMILQTERNGKPHFASKFSRVIDTQGEWSRFENNTWVETKNLPVRKYSKNSQEISKDRFIIKDVLAGLGEEKKDHRIVYIDDSPETAYLTRQMDKHPELRGRIIIVKLVKEAAGGVTAPENQAELQKLEKLIEEAAPGTLHMVWDFDCTLTRVHLYKSWNCAKYPAVGVVRFPSWAAKLRTMVEAGVESGKIPRPTQA
jgi:hypothetical protein